MKNDEIIDNELNFMPEDDQPEEADSGLPPWKILLVDDEQGIHDVSTMSLSRVELDNRKLLFLHAFSSIEAKEILTREKDIAVAMIDVVMETDHAGLDLVHYIRKELKNQLIRLILRTGQPGFAPERKVILDYDINDYKEKSELSAQKLFTTVITNLRSYRDLHALSEKCKKQP